MALKQMSKIATLLILLLSVAPISPAFAELTGIDNEALQSLIDEGTPVIDVRRLDEWKKTGVIKDSHLLTFFDEKGRYDAQKWLSQLSELIDPNEPFVLICHSGGRTSIIGQWLGKEFDRVYNVEDGMMSWIKAGNDTVVAP